MNDMNEQMSFSFEKGKQKKVVSPKKTKEKKKKRIPLRTVETMGIRFKVWGVSKTVRCGGCGAFMVFATIHNIKPYSFLGKRYVCVDSCLYTTAREFS